MHLLLKPKPSPLQPRKSAQAALVSILTALADSNSPLLSPAATSVIDLLESVILQSLSPVMQPNSKDSSVTSNPNPNHNSHLPPHRSRREALQHQTRLAAGAASVLRLLVGLRPIMTVLPEAQAVRAALRLHELLDVGHPTLSCRVLDVLSAMLSSATSALPPRAVAESVARLLQSERGRQARELVGGGRVRGDI